MLSAAFVGDMKAFTYPEIMNLWYMPYNFCLWYFDAMNEKLNYRPGVIHFAGAKFKPWMGQYPIFLEQFQKRLKLRSLDELKLGQAEYFYLWHEYVLKTAWTLKQVDENREGL